MRGAWLTTAILLLLTICEQAFARDLIVLVDGKQLDVVITAESVDGIEYKDATTGSTQKRKADEILWVTYEDAPNDYKSGIEALQIKKYPEAAGYFSKAQKTFLQSKNDWHKDYLEFYLAYALLMSKESNIQYVKLAFTKFQNFNKTRPNSRFAIPCFYYMAECQLAQNNFVDAKTSFEAVTKLNRPLFASMAKAGLARVSYADKKYDEALKLGIAELQSGVHSSEMVSVMADILLDKQPDFDAAFSLSTKLADKGDNDFKSAIFELKGCAGFRLKKYEESFEDLLRSSILYSKEGSDGPRSNLYLFASLKALMAANPANYPDWQYRNKLVEFQRKLTVADQNALKTFQL